MAVLCYHVGPRWFVDRQLPAERVASNRQTNPPAFLLLKSGNFRRKGLCGSDPKERTWNDKAYVSLVFQNDPNTLWGDIWTP